MKQEESSSLETSLNSKENAHTNSPSNRQPGQLPSPPPPPLPFRPLSDSSTSAPPGTLPPQLLSLLSSIQSTLKTQFSVAPPHTAQRLAELILRPTLHYRTLPSYLRALDRVISVSSPANCFPLPAISHPFVPSNGRALNGSLTPDSSDTPIADDFIGGAELTPIPWLNGATSPSYLNNDRASASDLRTESTSLIDGPNGAGSLETVTVTVNGIVRTGHEGLLRHDDDAGPVPITSRSMYGDRTLRSHVGTTSQDQIVEEMDERVTARGPEEIGVEDMGPQAPRSGGFDVEAALGRKGEGETIIENAGTEKEQQDGDGDYVIVEAEDVKEDKTPRANPNATA
ncbi:hypothetical protein MMC07_007100 [Pseudocyphellaria aurata]|nr:hypothetical protein [Pseudocyphellaria aurata]